jgi:hypothetical protein
VRRRLGIGLFAGACAVSLAGCGSTGLVGNQNAGSVSDVSVTVGQPADSIAWIQNRTGQAVTLESATVLPLKGFRRPRLVHVAVERMGGSTFRGIATGGADRGWPPSIPVTRLSGYRLQSGGTMAHHSAMIVFGVVAGAIGRYAVAGVNVTVQKDGAPVTVQAIGPLAFCVSTKQHVVPCPTAFTDRALRASNAFEGG